MSRARSFPRSVVGFSDRAFSCGLGRARAVSRMSEANRSLDSRRWQSPRDQFRIHTYSWRSVLRCLTVALTFGARPIAYRTSWGSTRRVTPRVYNGTRKRVRNDSCLARVQPSFSGSATQKRNGTGRREGLYVHNFRVWCLRESCSCTAPEGKYLCPPPTFEPTRRAQEEKEEAAFAVRYRSSVHLRADRNTARSLWRTYRSGPLFDYSLVRDRESILRRFSSLCVVRDELHATFS